MGDASERTCLNYRNVGCRAAVIANIVSVLHLPTLSVLLLEELARLIK